jgi:tRNA dimethylallyltransferase
MHARLAQRDAESAARIQANDSQRIQRALEIIELTGETPTALARRAAPQALPYDIVRVALIPSDRTLLHIRIKDRFQQMLELGLIDEVRTLQTRDDLSPELPSVRTVGYRQVWEYLTGGLTYNQMVEQAIAATRQLAKRQLTWLRRPMYKDRLSIFDCTEATEPSCLKLLHEAVATRDSA